MDKDSDLKNGIMIEMEKFNFVVVKESAEEIAGREAKSALKEEENTTILFILGVGMSSPMAGRHCRHGTRESSSQQVCESRLHPRWTTEIGAGARRPWLGKASLRQRIKARAEGGDCKEV
jgi:hypothetical protein